MISKIFESAKRFIASISRCHKLVKIFRQGKIEQLIKICKTWCLESFGWIGFEFPTVSLKGLSWILMIISYRRYLVVTYYYAIFWIAWNSVEYLEHNLFKNVSKWVTFLWQTQIQSINDPKRIKINKSHRNFTHLHPLIWIFKRFWCPKGFWQFFLSQKIYSLVTFLS